MRLLTSSDFRVGVLVGAVGLVLMRWALMPLFQEFGNWAMAYTRGVPITYWQMLGMRLRHVSSYRIVQMCVVAQRTGHPIDLRRFEMAYLGYGGAVSDPEELLAFADDPGAALLARKQRNPGAGAV